MVVAKVTPSPIYQSSIEAFKKSGFSLSSPDYQQTRAITNSLPLPDGVVLPKALVEEKVIPAGVDNHNITLTIVRPIGTENEVLPVIIYFHGGGWVFGSFKTTEKLVKNIAVNAHVAVVFVDYSLSPEVRFPVAVEECYSSILWVHENAEMIKVDPSNLVVGGDSAGGNLSAVTSIMLKERGHGNVVTGQILLYPAVTHHRQHYESYNLFGNGEYILSHSDIAFFGNAYFGNDKRPNDVRCAPLLATLDELKGLPRALILTAECDVLRDEGEDYARRLSEAGVDTCCMRMIGTIHGYATSPLETPQYLQTLNMISAFLNKRLC
ncbi:alpha/beta hydrolase fold-3 domain-containing protein [Halteromyces radiatus]|uniref:alpha/beta hydrolase fold-3 domain-containing protein n=1 Tax=Halteromyces radiatus TaxID=101107 RepID=UPI00221F2273|nr:alpha/beta hydrolase fold-3 domain-containing protein [Halteromyces radiatus]KAI8093789.1 alpha/beta hydrolase fold-3 domain-containing protein [Halteromyces radiatus]